MAPQEIRRFLTIKPFMPFRVHGSDGSQYDVLDPADAHVDMLYFSVGIDPDDSGTPAKSIYFSPDHVSRIEPLPEKATREGGNGRP